MNRKNCCDLLDLLQRRLPLAALNRTDVALAGAQSFLGQFPLLPKLFNHQPKRFIQFQFCCLAKGTMKPFRGRMSYAVYSLNVESHRCSPPTGMLKSRSRQYLGSLTSCGALLSSSSIVPGFA